MSTIEQYELHETVRALELAALQLETLIRRQDLGGEEINNRFSWQKHANCRGADQDLFFFFPKRGASTRKARAMMCSLRSESRVPRICSHPGRTFRDLGRPLGARTPQDPGQRVPGCEACVKGKGPHQITRMG
jgi:hypothetical protein